MLSIYVLVDTSVFVQQNLLRPEWPDRGTERGTRSAGTGTPSTSVARNKILRYAMATHFLLYMG